MHYHYILCRLEEGETAVRKVKPTLAQFKEQIDFYEKLHQRIKLHDSAVEFR